MRNLLAVGLGGCLGALARHAVNVLIAGHWAGQFPLATFLVNVSGSFLLGLFATVALERVPVDPAWRLFIATGFLGAYTTFSTFEYETHRLTETGALGWAALNVVASLLAGFAAVRLGIVLAR